jgi:hypothetical protein
VTNPFDACWHRIERAESHRKAAADVWNAWLEYEPYCTVLRYEGRGKFVLSVSQQVPTPPEMAVVMGEWFYNLRCALDYAVYATATSDSGKTPPPMAGQLEFPCAFSEDAWLKSNYRLTPLSDYHRIEIIRNAQPYRYPNPDVSALGWLHKLARIDRHRRLTFMLGYTAKLSPAVRCPPQCSVEFEPVERVAVDGDTEIARFTVSPWEDTWDLQVNARAGIDPEIGDWATSPYWSRIGYEKRLVLLSAAVRSFVAVLEYDCLGQSAQAALLTDAFKAESDARRADPGGIVGD